MFTVPLPHSIPSGAWRPGTLQNLRGAIAGALGLLLTLPTWGAEPPDLAPLDFQAPAAVTGPLGPTVRLVWGVTNHGPGLAAGWWSDSVWLSTDLLEWEPISGSSEIGPLAAGENYWRTNTVQVPAFESGTYHLMFTTDAEDFLRDWTVTGSCGVVELDQAHIGASFWGEFGGEEFLERVAIGQRQEKIG